MSYFEKINRERVTALLNALIEAPHFYRDDDPDLFTFLRRHRAEFERFYRDLYDWELVVDARTARLYKPRWYNRALKPSQHDAFDLTRRSDCIAFLLVLEYYEHLLEQQNLASEDRESPRFAFGELFEFARARLAEESREPRGDDDVRKLLRGLMPELVRYRFVREVPRDDGDGDIAESRVLYEALPALHHYDVRRLGPGALARAFAPELEEAAP